MVLELLWSEWTILNLEGARLSIGRRLKQRRKLYSRSSGGDKPYRIRVDLDYPESDVRSKSSDRYLRTLVNLVETRLTRRWKLRT